jgi:hypothetical protein
MAEYLMQDKDKAAFINRMNKVLSQIKPGLELDSNSFVDVPAEEEDDDKTIFIPTNELEEKVLDGMMDRKVFSYKIKKIDATKILDTLR